MGLDLYHMSVCEKEEADKEPVYVQNFDAHPSFIELNRHLIRHVYEHDLFFSIHVFNNESDYKEYMDHYQSELTHYLTGTMQSAEEAIKQIETYNNLPVDEKFVISSTFRSNKMHPSENIAYQTISYPVRSTKQEVFYCKQLGYQRKGMRTSFYEDFDNNTIYINKSDVLKAYEYVHANEEELPALQELFRKNFIDNFTEGLSFFETNW